MSSDSEGYGEDGSKAARACDSCRKKKIKCDKKIPCARCKTAGLHCEVTVQKPTEKKQRIHVSQNFETQIASIHDKLETIERLLKLNLDGTASIKRQPSSTPQHEVEPYSKGSPQIISSHPQDSSANKFYVGDSSLLSATFEAKHVLERGLTPEVSGAPRPGAALPKETPLGKALIALDKLVASSHNDELYFPAEMQTTHEISLQELPIPPLREIWELLQDQMVGGRGNWPMVPLSIERFQSMFSEIMSGKQMVDISSFICVNGVLPFLCQPLLAMVDVLEERGIDRRQLLQLLDNCTYNCRVASKKLTMHMVPSIPNIQALIFASTVAQECASPGECWTYTSYACRLSQALGLNRESYYTPLPEEDAIEARMTFFWCYVLDKMQALNFGRSPVLHDYDIDAELPELPSDAPAEVMAYYKISMIYVDMARLQEATYRELHSAEASKFSIDRRNSAIYKLDGEYREWWKGVQKMFSDHHEFDTEADLMSEKYQLTFCYNATLCTIHRLATRGVPTKPGRPPYNDACLEAAREAMRTCRALQGLRPDKKSTQNPQSDSAFFNSLVHWLFLSYPITPFFVLFGSVVTTRNKSDLELLGDLVTLFASFDNKSNAASKLYRLTRIFHRVATIIAQADNQQVVATAHAQGRATIPAVPALEEEFPQERYDPVRSQYSPPVHGQQQRPHQPAISSPLSPQPSRTATAPIHNPHLNTGPFSPGPSSHHSPLNPSSHAHTPQSQHSQHPPALTPLSQSSSQSGPPAPHSSVAQPAPVPAFDFGTMDWDAFASTQAPLDLMLEGNLDQFSALFGGDLDMDLGIDGGGHWPGGNPYIPPGGGWGGGGGGHTSK